MFGHTAHTVIFKYFSYFNNMCDEHVPKVSLPTSPPLPPIQGHHPNRGLPNLMTQEERIKVLKREERNKFLCQLLNNLLKNFH